MAAVYVAGLALAAVVTRGPIDRLDDRVTASVSRWVATQPGVGRVAATVSIAGTPIVLVLIVLVGAVVAESRGDRRAATALVLIGGLGAIVETALKVTVARARPELEALTSARGSSFPSGHAMNSMVVLVATAGLLTGAGTPGRSSAAHRERRGARPALAGALVIAVVVGLSRVVLGVHHPGDVLSGWALAVLWLTLTLGTWSPGGRLGR